MCKTCSKHKKNFLAMSPAECVAENTTYCQKHQVIKAHFSPQTLKQNSEQAVTELFSNKGSSELHNRKTYRPDFHNMTLQFSNNKGFA